MKHASNNVRNVLCCDAGNHVLRKFSFVLEGGGIEPNLRFVSTSLVGGQPNVPNMKDGPTSDSNLNGPVDIVAANQDQIFFFVDSDNHMIRMINTITHRIYTIAGNGISGFRDGISTTSQFFRPYGISINKQQNKLYVCDCYNHVLREITFPNLQCLLNEFEDDLRDIVPKCVNVNLFCGTPNEAGHIDEAGEKAKFRYPISLAFSTVDEDVLFVSDCDNNCIRKIRISTKQVTTFAGTPATPGFKDGNPTVAKFNRPRGICLDDFDNIFVCDCRNHAIRKINNKGYVTTIAGESSPHTIESVDGNGFVAKLKFPKFIVLDKSLGVLLFTQSDAIREITIWNILFEWKLKQIVRFCRLLTLSQSQQPMLQRVLFNLICLELLQYDSLNQVQKEIQIKLIQFATDRTSLRNVTPFFVQNPTNSIFRKYLSEFVFQRND